MWSLWSSQTRIVPDREEQVTLPHPHCLSIPEQLRAEMNFSLWGRGKLKTPSSTHCCHKQLHRRSLELSQILNSVKRVALSSWDCIFTEQESTSYTPHFPSWLQFGTFVHLDTLLECAPPWELVATAHLYS